MANYSQQDFTSAMEDLLSIVASSTTKWNPENSTEADPGVVLLKIMALLEDKFEYKFDMAFAQAYLDTVSNREYAQDLLRMLGYAMKQGRSSSGFIAIEALDAPAQPIPIPMFSVVTNTSKTIKFFTTVDTTINNTDKTDIPVMSGEIFQVSKEGISTFTLKDVDESGRLPIGKSNLAQNGIFISTILNISNPEVYSNDWTYLDLALAHPKGSKFFTVSTLETGEIYIQFPKDFEVLIGSSHFRIDATYTRGSASNITADTLTAFENSDINVLFNIYHDLDFYNGQDSESIEQARANYYEQKDICSTLVSSNDFATAIKYLLDDAGVRKFSNVLTSSAIDRAYKTNNQYDGYNYLTMDERGSTIPTYRMDVVPLKASSSYKASFEIVPSAPQLEGEIQTALADYKSLPVSIHCTNVPRILAVTSPSMTIRISDYTDTKAVGIKELVRNYFNSSYRADLLTPGAPLDYSRIVKDIKRLSPSIQSISMDEFKYSTYKTYLPVDGAVSVRASEDVNIKKEILTRAVLSGDLPLYKFSNRQNTRSKLSAGYSSLSAAEQVSPMPWGVVETVGTGTSVSPTISDLKISNTWAQQGNLDGEGRKSITLNKNHILQVRRPLCSSDMDYGHGMQYSFYSTSKNEAELADPISISNSSALLAGSTLKSLSIIYRTTNITLSSPISVTVSDDGITYGEAEDLALLLGNKYYKLQQDVTITGVLDLSAGSLLTAGTTIKNASNINGASYYSPGIPKEINYTLLEGEKLCIFNSSGVLQETLEATSKIVTKGIDIPVTGPYTMLPSVVEGQILNSSKTISILLDTISPIDTSFSYYLSLRSSGDLTLNSTGYMLEEDEILVLANRAVSEYTIFGPGTVLSSVNVTTLVNSPFTSLDTIDKSLFRAIPSLISAQAYEITTYKQPKYFLHNINTDPDSLRFPTDWTSLSGKKLVVKDSVDADFESDFSDSEYEARLIAMIVTDDSGVADIEAPIEFNLNYGGSVLQVVGLAQDKSQLSSSTPFAALLTGKVGQLLLPEGVTSYIYANKIERYDDKGFTREASVYDFIITINEDSFLSTDTTLTIQTSLYAPTGTALILTNFRTEGADTAGDKTISISGKEGETSSPALFYSLGTATTDISALSHGQTLHIPNSSNALQLEVTVPLVDGDGAGKKKIDLPAGMKIIFSKLSFVSGFSRELLNSDVPESDKDYFNPAIVSNAILSTPFLKDFDWLAYPTELLEHPTSSNAYLNSSHPLNKRTLPYIEFAPQSIRVVRN